MRVRSFFLGAALALTAIPALAQERAFEVREGGGSRAQFTSDAPLERMTGTSTGVSGSFTADPAALASAHGTIEVRVATIRTGIDLRDHHLQSDTWLDAARFPTAKFELLRVTGATSITPGQETRVTLHGRFSVHGQTRPVTAQARVTWTAGPNGTAGGSVRIRARFRIRLTDYGVTVPAVVALKVNNEITVDVNLVANERR